jgi:hypothetical protein
MAAPEALEVADSVPQALALQPDPESAQETPLFWLSLATVAVNCCVCVSRRDEVAGVTLTDIACGGGTTAVGGSLCGWELLAPPPDTDAHPPIKTADKKHTSTPMGARAAARTPESEIKVEVLRCISLKEPYFLRV